MADRQATRRTEISRLTTKLAKSNGSDAEQLLKRFDALISEASAVDRLESPQQAAASLEIALHAMGADPRHPRREERLIMMATAFLRTLGGCVMCTECLMAPSFGGVGAIVGKLTGLA